MTNRFVSILLALFLSSALAADAAVPEIVRIDAAAPTAPFAHYWETMMGAGRAASALRADFQRDLIRTKQATGLYYLRFHAIFHDELGVYNESPAGAPLYNFQYTDEIYDSMLAAGVRPFVELGFMPRALALRPDAHPFWYHPLVAPPKDYAAWDGLIRAFAKHLIARYGEDEVARWYFEVWNEPNGDFWTGRPADTSYYELYDHTARALKSVSTRLKVGGPATAHGAWLSDFIAHSAAKNLPLDFVSSHIYGNDDLTSVLPAGAAKPDSHYGGVCPAIARMHVEIGASRRPNLPLIVSEFNATYDAHDPVLASPFMGAWLADTVRRCEGLAAMLSWWTFTDVFEEEGVPQRPMDGFGLIGIDGIPKPAFAAFALLHRLGDREIGTSSSHLIATKRSSDGALVLAAYNLVPPGGPGAPLQLRLQISGAGKTAHIQRVDQTHANPMPLYKKMGAPVYPSADQVRALIAAADLGPTQTLALRRGQLDLTVPANGLALIEIPR